MADTRCLGGVKHYFWVLGTVEGKDSWETNSKERLLRQGILQSLNEVTAVQISLPLQTAFTLGKNKRCSCIAITENTCKCHIGALELEV